MSIAKSRAATRARRRRPISKAQRIVREPVERELDLQKGRCGLHQITQRQLARQIFRRAKHERNYGRQKIVGAREKNHFRLALDHEGPFLSQTAQKTPEISRFGVFLVAQARRLAFMPRAAQGIAEIAFGLRLFLYAGDEWPAKYPHAE